MYRLNRGCVPCNFRCAGCSRMYSRCISGENMWVCGDHAVCDSCLRGDDQNDDNYEDDEKHYEEARRRELVRAKDQQIWLKHSANSLRHLPLPAHSQVLICDYLLDYSLFCGFAFANGWHLSSQLEQQVSLFLKSQGIEMALTNFLDLVPMQTINRFLRPNKKLQKAVLKRWPCVLDRHRFIRASRDRKFFWLT